MQASKIAQTASPIATDNRMEAHAVRVRQKIADPIDSRNVDSVHVFDATNFASRHAQNGRFRYIEGSNPVVSRCRNCQEDLVLGISRDNKTAIELFLTEITGIADLVRKVLSSALACLSINPLELTNKWTFAGRPSRGSAPSSLASGNQPCVDNVTSN